MVGGKHQRLGEPERSPLVLTEACRAAPTGEACKTVLPTSKRKEPFSSGLKLADWSSRFSSWTVVDRPPSAMMSIDVSVPRLGSNLAMVAFRVWLVLASGNIASRMI